MNRWSLFRHSLTARSDRRSSPSLLSPRSLRCSVLITGNDWLDVHAELRHSELRRSRSFRRWSGRARMGGWRNGRSAVDGRRSGRSRSGLGRNYVLVDGGLGRGCYGVGSWSRTEGRSVGTTTRETAVIGVLLRQRRRIEIAAKDERSV